MQTNTPPRAEYLPIEKLHPFENHPFQVKDDAEMDQLVFSVLTQGLLTPIVVLETDTEEVFFVLSKTTFSSSGTMSFAVYVGIPTFDEISPCFQFFLL